jgi:hypothetical protein
MRPFGAGRRGTKAVERKTRIRVISQLLPRYFESSRGMTELEILDRDIRGLKELLRVAWKELASPALTPHERREARNRIMLCSAELRRQLEQAEARSAGKKVSQEPASPGLVKPKLRLLPEGY